jgi:hypothetical protein
MSDSFKETFYFYLLNQISWFYGKEAIVYFSDCVLDHVKIMILRKLFSEFVMLLASLVMCKMKRSSARNTFKTVLEKWEVKVKRQNFKWRYSSRNHSCNVAKQELNIAMSFRKPFFNFIFFGGGG